MYARLGAIFVSIGFLKPQAQEVQLNWCQTVVTREKTEEDKAL